MSEFFEWHKDLKVAVRTQMAIAVYLNPYGELVLRQEGQFHPDEDVWIVIAPDNVVAVTDAMHAAMGAVPATRVTKDRTAAKRQRRHREKHRDNQGGVTPVTGQSTVTGRNVVTHSQGGLPLAAE